MTTATTSAQNLTPISKVGPVLTTMLNQPMAMQVELTNEEYHADRTAVSSTGLKELLRSPMHYQHYLTAERTEKECFRIGTAIHTALLEPDRFAQEYVIAPEAGRSNATKEAYKKFVDEHVGSRFISQSEMDMIHGIVKQVNKHDFARELLKIGKPEQSFFWTDEETGIICKIRPDLLALGYTCLDVKSTEDASAESFGKACANLKYDLSAAMYVEGIYRCTGEEIDFSFLAVEKKAPHGVALYKASEEFMAKGHAKFRKALRILKQCRDTNSYPSYQPDGRFEELDLPRWAK